ncbi:uncharacterized protein LOC113853742 isoform X3 [Abrus precatorius]|uniref:Uncharacterized protein LOC113853742 isoform X3 n=1 Tax=Abrus precatorius TaxID=3816 RepID=A0A8B8KAC4_ABRPR|nr:uncharacterized protein LOC113853742 isoform X3 [Abrus precatorius]
MSKALGEDEEDEERDCFYDSHDRLLSLSSSCSCSCSNSDEEEQQNYNHNHNHNHNFALNNYDIWISQPSSVSERRTRLFQTMGLSDHSSIVRSKSDAASSSSRHQNSTPLVNNPNLSAGDSPSKPPSGKNCRRSDSSVDFGVSEEEEKVCTIRDLDNGKEFVVKEVREDGMWDKLREVGTGRQLTMEEFEMTVGHSPIVQELMRRQSVEEDNVDANVSGGSGGGGGGGGNGNGGSKVKKKGGGWLKSIKSVASSMAMAGHKERRSSDERDTSSEKGGRRSSSATDDSQDASFHGPERVRVRQYGKSCKELTALYKSQEIQAHSGSIWSIKFSLDGKYLASAGEDCVIHVWQVVESERKGELLLMEKPEDVNVNMLLVVNGSPEPTLLSPLVDNHPERKRKGRSSISRKSLSLDQFVVPDTVFALTEKPVCSFQGHLHDVLDLSWSKSQHLLSSSMDKTVRLWHLSSKSCLKIFSHSDYADLWMLRFAYGAFLIDKLLIGLICMRWSLLLVIHLMVRVHLLVHTRVAAIYTIHLKISCNRRVRSICRTRKRNHITRKLLVSSLPLEVHQKYLFHLLIHEFGLLMALIWFISLKAFEMPLAPFQLPSRQMVNTLLQQARIPMYTFGKMKLIAGLTEVKVSLSPAHMNIFTVKMCRWPFPGLVWVMHGTCMVHFLENNLSLIIMQMKFCQPITLLPL